MELFMILALITALLILLAYFGVIQQIFNLNGDGSDSPDNDEGQDQLERTPKTDIDTLTAEIIERPIIDNVEISEKENTSKIESVKLVPEYTVLTKMKSELLPQEYHVLQQQYNHYLTNGKKSESFDSSIKENTRLFIAYDKSTGIPVGQAAVLILDTHDFWGAFSKIRNLNLDTQSVILYNVCVIPEHRRRGIAEHLLQSVHMWARPNNKPNIILFVDPNNSTAIRLYQRMGYNVDKSHYAPNGAELMMRLSKKL